ncbi:MAG: penicillin-binding protein activator, partial [Rhizobiales bacterium]|nr:penicillin-binding protein activator [Hyphomicrobiales bacterium]
MKKNSIFKVSILAILVIGLASCTTAPNFGRPELTDKPLTPTSTLTSDVPNRLIRDGAIRVGAVLPLSTKEGKLIKNALELAVGNNSGAKIILFTENSGDSRSSGAARSAARKLLAKGVEIIIGPIRSSNVRAVANEARAFGVPVIAFSQDINAAGNGVYLQTILREDEIRRVVKHSAARGFTKFASLTPKNPLGRIVASTFKSSANRYGSLVASATYSPYSAKSTQAQKIQFIKDIKRFAAQANSAKANAILLPESPAANRHIAKVLKGVGFKNTGVKFLGTSLWSKPGTSGISILSGGWYANT